MIGLLYELIQGKARALRQYINPADAVEKLRGWQGTPFSKKNLRAWTDTLRSYGFDGFGLEIMCDGRTGEELDERVCMGIVPVSVLYHVATDWLSRHTAFLCVFDNNPGKKTYARGIRGPNNARTRSPIDGRGCLCIYVNIP